MMKIFWCILGLVGGFVGLISCVFNRFDVAAVQWIVAVYATVHYYHCDKR